MPFNLLIISQFQNQISKMNSRLYSTVVMSKVPESQGFSNSHDNLDQQIRKITDSVYLKLCSQQISQDEMKIQFSKQILTLVLSTHQKLNSSLDNKSECQLNAEYFRHMDELILQNTSFLKTVYPKMKGLKSRNNFVQYFKDRDDSDKVQFDFLANMGIKFEGRKQNSKKTSPVERAYILEQIQQLFNKIIIASKQAVPKFNHILRSVILNELPRKYRSVYQETIKDPRKFQVDILLADDTKLFNKQLLHENLTIDSFGLFQVIQKWVQDLSNMLNNPERYLEDKQYLKINNQSFRNKQISKVKSMKIFGRKSNISRSTIDDSSWDLNLFGQLPENQKDNDLAKGNSQKNQSLWEYIFSGFRQVCKNKNNLQGFDNMDQKSKNRYADKRSADLWGQNRHIRKKVDAIQGQMQKINQNRQQFANHCFRQSGYPLPTYMQALNQIGRNKDSQLFILNQMLNLRECYSQNSKIVDKNRLRQRYTENQKKIYSFSQNTYDFVQEMLLEKLVFLITTVLEHQDSNKMQEQNMSVLQDIQLFSLRLSEMMSGSLVGDQSLITSVYKSMMDLHSARQISIMKIKNRLDSCDRDILIQFTISGNPVTCCLKLILQYKQTAVQIKHISSEMLYGLFEEIQKKAYGPLSYLSHILATTDHRIQYLSQIRKVQVHKNSPLSRLCHCGKGIVSEESPYFIFEKQIRKIITEDNSVNLKVYSSMLENSFVCGICQKAKKRGMNSLPVQKCYECNFIICVDCDYEIYPEHQMKAYLSLLGSIARINDQSCHANLIFQNAQNMEYSHSYRKQIQKVSMSEIQKKVQNHYDIVIQGRNIVKYVKNDSVQSFWRRVRDKIELKKLPCYEKVIKKQNYAGIILRPRQLLRKKGTPFIFIHYNAQKKKFSKFSSKLNNYEASLVEINQLQLQLEQNDIFFPIIWLQDEELVPQYIWKVLQTNPFCKKSKKKQSPVIQKIKQIYSRPQLTQRDNSSMQNSNMRRRSSKKTKISHPRYSSNRLVR